jgi:vancomycin resistance protein YoaR
MNNTTFKPYVFLACVFFSFWIVTGIILGVSHCAEHRDIVPAIGLTPSATETDAGVAEDGSAQADSSTTEEQMEELLPMILGSATTTFQSYGRTYSNRARNIRLATRILNETVVEPGAEFSFNEIVGPRDREHGFREAPTIMSGEMTESYGGGV